MGNRLGLTKVKLSATPGKRVKKTSERKNERKASCVRSIVISCDRVGFVTGRNNQIFSASINFHLQIGLV